MMINADEDGICEVFSSRGCESFQLPFGIRHTITITITILLFHLGTLFLLEAIPQPGST